MNDLISVIIPVYNVNNYLDKCLETVVNQTYSSLEIILINDGSTDGSKEKCDEWVKKDDRIKVIHKENEGASKTRKVGVEQSTGKYITFIDADDFVDYEMIEKLHKALINTNSQISICNHKRAYNYKDKVLKKTNQIEEYTTEEAIEKLLEEKNINSYLWNKLYLKELFREVEFPNVKDSEDIDIFFQLLCNAKKISFTNDELYVYMLRKNSLSHNYTKQVLLNEINIVNKRHRIINEQYSNLKLLNDMSRIKYIFRYHKKTALFLENTDYKNKK